MKIAHAMIVALPAGATPGMARAGQQNPRQAAKIVDAENVSRLVILAAAFAQICPFDRHRPKTIDKARQTMDLPRGAAALHPAAASGPADQQFDLRLTAFIIVATLITCESPAIHGSDC
jgi:hypothetical protein